MKNLKTYKMFESVGELTPEQIEWLDSCTRRGTWTLNPQTGLVDVDGDFNCSEQGLTDFKGIRFGVVRGYFYCYGNNLTTLEGAPQKVRVSFSCNDNQLTSLEGAPQEVGPNFNCGHNQLTSLVGAPQRVSGGFYCHNNQLTSLVGAPQEVDRDLYCNNNPVSEKTLRRIFSRMKKWKSYIQSVESLWSKIPLEDQALLYRPEFEWVSPEEGRKLEAIQAYQGFKSMI